MGPRLFSRGMSPPSPPPPDGGAGFNGAAALQPRNGSSSRMRSTFTSIRLQWGRGSSAAECLAPASRNDHTAALASMGPRLFSRGMHRKRGGFAFCYLSFNGAAALQPRNEVDRNECHLHGIHASMGPRLFSRGMLLLWLRPRLPRAALQWGRGSSAAECRRQLGGGHLGAPASMGPRLFSRGMRDARPRGRQPRHASMGPRLFSRGMWTTTHFGGSRSERLQWGRGSSAAEW